MQLKPTQEGLIKQHPLGNQPPKAEEHKDAPHYMEKIMYKPKGQKPIKSLAKQIHKEYQHSIGGKMHYGHHIGK